MTEQPPLIPLLTGERLQRERNKRGLELQDVALQLRIDLPVMQAIEQDKLGHLASIYQRGYITAYARYLDFDASDIKQMLEVIGTEQPEILTVFPEAGNPNQTDRWLQASSYVLASLLVGTLAWQFTHEAVRLSQGTPEQVRNNTSINSATEISGETHVNASIAALEILQQQSAARTNGGESAWAGLQRGAEDAIMGSSLADGEFNLDLTASGDSWVKISDATGRQLEVDIVRGGSSKHYTGIAPFNIQFGRASAISLYLDGQAVDLAPFTNGDVTQMILNGSNHGVEPGGNKPDGG